MEDVRQQFASELDTIRKLRFEEEAFREKEASWTIRASSLSEDVRKQDKKLCDLTDRIAQEQKSLTDLEYEIESCQKRILKAESLKDLSIQRRFPFLHVFRVLTNYGEVDFSKPYFFYRS